MLLDSVRNDYDKAEQLYKRAIAANPLHAYSLYNYALLLEDVRKDYDNAETVRFAMLPSGVLCLQASACCWHSATRMGVVGVFVPHASACNHRQHFRLAIKADPKDSVVLADYAQFLKSVRKVRCLPCRRNAKL